MEGSMKKIAAFARWSKERVPPSCFLRLVGSEGDIRAQGRRQAFPTSSSRPPPALHRVLGSTLNERITLSERTEVYIWRTQFRPHVPSSSEMERSTISAVLSERLDYLLAIHTNSPPDTGLGRLPGKQAGYRLPQGGRSGGNPPRLSLH